MKTRACCSGWHMMCCMALFFLLVPWPRGVWRPRWRAGFPREWEEQRSEVSELPLCSFCVAHRLFAVWGECWDSEEQSSSFVLLHLVTDPFASSRALAIPPWEWRGRVWGRYWSSGLRTSCLENQSIKGEMHLQLTWRNSLNGAKTWLWGKKEEWEYREWGLLRSTEKSQEHALELGQEKSWFGGPWGQSWGGGGISMETLHCAS